jgi:hypothetical protein
MRADEKFPARPALSGFRLRQRPESEIITEPVLAKEARAGELPREGVYINANENPLGPFLLAGRGLRPFA